MSPVYSVTHLTGLYPGSGLIWAGPKVEERIARRYAVGVVALLGCGFGFLALSCGDTWVTRSPLFKVLGGAACFVLLVFGLALGGILWLVTGSSWVFFWAKGLLPFCVQPYRGAAGIVAMFLLFAVIVRDIPWGNRLTHPVAVYVRWSIAGFGAFIWAVALLILLAR